MLRFLRCLFGFRPPPPAKTLTEQMVERDRPNFERRQRFTDWALGDLDDRPLSDALREQTASARGLGRDGAHLTDPGRPFECLPITAELLGLEPRRRRAWGDIPSFVPPADNSPAFWYVRRECNGLDEGLGDHLSEPGPQWDCMNPAHDRCYAWWHRRRTPATPRAGQRVRADVPPSVGSYQPVTTIDPDAQNPV